MQKKKGISLIVLVITIIVMIILASAVVISLNNNGIIDRASSAKEQARIAEEREEISIAYLNAVANKSKSSISTSMENELEEKYGEVEVKQYLNNYLIKMGEDRYYTIKNGNVVFGKEVFGLYDSNGKMVYSWDELIENNYLTVTDGVLTSGYVNENNHPNTEYIEGALVIDESVTKIGSNGLRALSKMTEVYFPKTIESINVDALLDCINLSYIYVDENNLKYTTEDGVLFNKNMKTILVYPNMHGTTYSIPNGVTTIAESAFRKLNNLRQVEIPNSVTSLGWYAFSECRELESIEIPGSIKDIPYYCFRKCKNLKDITICEGVTRIASYCFTDLPAVTSVILPDSITQVSYLCFSACTSLEYVRLSSNIKKIEGLAFGGTYTWDKNKLEKVTYKGVDYYGTTTLFEALTNNEVNYASDCFKFSPFVD